MNEPIFQHHLEGMFDYADYVDHVILHGIPPLYTRPSVLHNFLYKLTPLDLILCD